MSIPEKKRPDRREPDPAEATRDVARSEREYGHSSGDRNVRRSEEDAPSYRSGGIQRDAGTEDKDELEP